MGKGTETKTQEFQHVRTQLRLRIRSPTKKKKKRDFTFIRRGGKSTKQTELICEAMGAETAAAAAVFPMVRCTVGGV